MVMDTFDTQIHCEELDSIFPWELEFQAWVEAMEEEHLESINSTLRNLVD
jgi:hypothetical protein